MGGMDVNIPEFVNTGNDDEANSDVVMSNAHPHHTTARTRQPKSTKKMTAPSGASEESSSTSSPSKSRFPRAPERYPIGHHLHPDTPWYPPNAEVKAPAKPRSEVEMAKLLAGTSLEDLAKLKEYHG